ncbi:MAG: M20/M25/M40 family metallo-hydrolase [Anaerolineales bacterium]|nr:M20/M25/M40 family metallo-hydrolase [Anaerolineales bacterium]
MTNPVDLIRQERLLELTQQLVAIPSVTNHEQAIADWMADHFKRLGLSGVRRLPVAESGDSVVGMIDGRADKPAILLNFHMDTFGVFDGWETDPFTPTLRGNRLYGLGSHDMKGGAACVLGAVEALLQAGTELDGRLIVAATTDEENWSRGAHEVIKTGLLANCAYCLVPEPSNAASLTVGQRGRHVFHLQFYGKTVHAAYGSGVNAVVDAAKVAAVLSNKRNLDLGYSEPFGLPGTLEVIGLHGGGTLILVPEQADLFIDRHILPGQTLAEAVGQIETAVSQANISGRCALTWDERPTPAPSPFLVPSDSHFAQTVTRLMREEQGVAEIRHVLGRSVADTNHFAVHGGVPTMIYGPQGGNTCECNEWVDVASLTAVARTYVRAALELLC